MPVSSDLAPTKPPTVLTTLRRLCAQEGIWMGLTIVLLALFLLATIDLRIRTIVLFENVVQLLLAIGFTTLSVASFLPTDRETGLIEHYYRIGIATQLASSIAAMIYSDGGIIFQISITYVVPIVCMLLVVVGYQQSCKTLRITSGLTRLIPFLVAASTLILVLLLLAATNVNTFSNILTILLDDRIISRFGFGVNLSIWIYLIAYHTKLNNTLSQSMQLSALQPPLVHLCMMIFHTSVPHEMYLSTTRVTLFIGSIILSISIINLHKEKYNKVYTRAKKSVRMLKETKAKLNTLNSTTSDIKNNQNELQQARALLAGKDALLISLTQELRTLLNGEMGNIELLIESKLNPLQQDYAIALEKSVDALIALINNTTMFVRADTGRIIIDESTSFKIGSLLDHVLDNKKVKSDIDVYYTIDENVPEVLLGDASILEMILNHLLDNALKFTHKGEVAVKVSALRSGDREVFLSIQVKDTGKGIPKSSLAGLGSPFYSLRENGCGSGLGVAISDRLARLFKYGRLKIQSEANKGSSFTFSGLFHEADAGSPHRSQEAFTNKSIVCIDDNPNVINALQSMVQRYTLSNVRGVASFQEAEKLVLQLEDEGQLPDVLLLDYIMPGANGTQTYCTDLVRRLKENSRTKAIHIVVMVSSEQRKSLLVPQVDGYLTKPIRCKQLLTILRKFGSNRESSPGHSDRLGSSDSDPGLNVSSDDRVSARDAFLSAETDKSKLHILIAEDNMLNQEVVKRIVQSVGFTTKITQNGEECVEEFKKENYDLILMDCLMPVLSGFEATIQIRKWEQLNGLKHTPIIALTATDSPGTRSHCLSVGMDDYLIKPVKKSVLEKLLKDYLSKRQQMTENKSQSLAAEAGLQLLLVEDNPVNAKIAKKLLEKYHWKVDLAEDGKQALDFVMGNYYKYSVILMDIHLPIMDGLTCTTLIRQFEKEQMLPAKPIIALTADSMSSHKNHCLKAGCTEYMNKPIDYPLLVALLERYNKRNLSVLAEAAK